MTNTSKPKHSGCALCAAGLPVVKKRIVSGKMGMTVWGPRPKPVRVLAREALTMVMADVTDGKIYHPALTDDMVKRYFDGAWLNLAESFFVKIAEMLGHQIDTDWIVKQQWLDDDAGAGICTYRTGCFVCQQIFQITYDDRYEEWAFNMWSAHKPIEPHPTDPDIITMDISVTDIAFFRRQRSDMFCSKFRALL